MGEPKKVCDRVWEMMESGNLDKLADVVDADCDFKMPGGVAFKGVEALHQMLGAYRAAFLGIRNYSLASTYGVLILSMLIVFSLAYRRALRKQGEVW